MQGHGIGKKLMEKIINYCRARGTKRLTGPVLLENNAMIHLAKKFQFKVKTLTVQNVVEISLNL
jgi:acetyltransferase